MESARLFGVTRPFLQSAGAGRKLLVCLLERVLTRPFLQSPGLGVSAALKEVVTFSTIGVIPAIFSVVAWVSPMPVRLTCSLVGLVVIIRCELFLLPLPFAGALAVFFTAISLILYTRIWSKQAPTMCAWNNRVHGFLPGGEKP